jgi:hypothetical protein
VDGGNDAELSKSRFGGFLPVGQIQLSVDLFRAKTLTLKGYTS